LRDVLAEEAQEVLGPVDQTPFDPFEVERGKSVLYVFLPKM